MNQQLEEAIERVKALPDDADDEPFASDEEVRSVFTRLTK